jgi:hypothetical protein
LPIRRARRGRRLAWTVPQHRQQKLANWIHESIAPPKTAVEWPRRGAEGILSVRADEHLVFSWYKNHATRAVTYHDDYAEEALVVSFQRGPKRWMMDPKATVIVDL